MSAVERHGSADTASATSGPATEGDADADERGQRLEGRISVRTGRYRRLARGSLTAGALVLAALVVLWAAGTIASDDGGFRALAVLAVMFFAIAGVGMLLASVVAGRAANTAESPAPAPDRDDTVDPRDDLDPD